MGFQQYYRPEDQAAKYMGNGILLEGLSAITLKNLGPIWGAKIKETLTPVESKADNTDMGEIIDKQEGELSFSILAGHLYEIYHIRGGLDVYEATLAATPTAVTGELVTLPEGKWVRLANRMGDRTICTSIVVTENVTETPDTYVLTTDYTLEVDTAGYTRIKRVTSSTGITAGATVKVAYSYSPAIREALYTGGKTIIEPRYYRYLHVARIDENDKIWGYMYDIYKGYLQNGSELTPPADDNKKDPLKEPFVLKCKQDDSKAEGKRLWCRETLKGVTLTDLGMTYLDGNELGTQIRALLAEASP